MSHTDHPLPPAGCRERQVDTHEAVCTGGSGQCGRLIGGQQQVRGHPQAQTEGPPLREAEAQQA